MQLRPRRLRLLRCCSTLVVFKKWHKHNDFIAFSMHIYYNFRYKESEEKRLSDLMLPFTPLKFYDLLYSRVWAGAVVASKFLPGAEPEQHKNDAAPQHCWYRQNTLLISWTIPLSITVFVLLSWYENYSVSDFLQWKNLTKITLLPWIKLIQNRHSNMIWRAMPAHTETCTVCMHGLDLAPYCSCTCSPQKMQLHLQIEYFSCEHNNPIAQ
jgi:hypothetical protein